MATEAPAAPAAAAPAAPATPNPVTSNAAPGSATAKAFDDIDGLFHAEPAPEPKPDKATPADKPADKPADAPVDDKAKPDAPAKPADAKPPKAASLREALDISKAEAAKYRAEVEEWKKKASTPVEDAEKKKLMEERDSWTKTREDLETELKFSNYERSAEFKTKYQQPFEDSYKEGASLIQGFNFKEADVPDGQGGAIEGKVRKGTQDDWDKFLTLSSDEANKFAVEHFGHNSQEMILARRELSKMVQSRDKALKEFREKGTEREKQMREASEKQTKEFQTLFETENKTALDHPNLKPWMTPTEGDEKGKTILEKGFSIADRAFGDTSKMTTAERARLYSAVRNKAGAYDHVVHLAKKFQSEVAELKTKLEEYENSEPGLEGKGGGKRGEGQAVTGLAAVDSILDKMAR